MKYPSFFFLVSVVLLLAGMPLPAQTTDDSDTETPPPGGTIITSDELHSDQNTHISIFTNNVVVIGTNFKMNCQEMTVYFDKDNKVQRIVSTGDVVIIQPDRVTHCGHAEYFHDEDKFILTDQPVILDHKNTVAGPEITIFRGNQKMIVKGGRSRVILGPDSMSSPKTNAPSDTLPTSTDAK
jgi:lipopolysaccharide transport protein LptA